MNRYRFIAVEKAHHSVVLLCRVLGVAKSAFYAWQHHQSSAHAQADERLTEQIRAIHDQSHCTYGAPRVHAELRKRGTRVARKRVARLMRTAKLVGRCPRRFRRTTIPDETAQTPDLVQRQFRPTAPDALWVADITYVRTWEGWLYLAVILDAFSRRVVAGRSPIMCGPNWQARRCAWRCPVADRSQGGSITLTGVSKADSSGRRNTA